MTDELTYKALRLEKELAVAHLEKATEILACWHEHHFPCGDEIKAIEDAKTKVQSINF